MTSLGASALAMTRDFKPDAITLDICLPDIDGWRVIERLKNDIHTRHIPVCVISTEEARERSLRSGARGFILKPVQTKDDLEQGVARLKEFAVKPTRGLLLVSGDSAVQRRSARPARRRRPCGRRRRQTRPKALEMLKPRAGRLRGPRSGSAGHDGRGLCHGTGARSGPGATCRSSFTARRSCPETAKPGTERSPATQTCATSARRTVARPGDPALALPVRRNCPTPGGRRWSNCTRATKCWPARKCWSSTTTFATSSP